MALMSISALQIRDITRTQSSLRQQAGSAGRAEDARPLAWRYMY